MTQWVQSLALKKRKEGERNRKQSRLGSLIQHTPGQLSVQACLTTVIMVVRRTHNFYATGEVILLFLVILHITLRPPIYIVELHLYPQNLTEFLTCF